MSDTEIDLFEKFNISNYDREPLDVIPPRNLAMVILGYVLLCGCLFLHLICSKEKLVYRYFPQFCYFMPIIFISHLALIIGQSQATLIWFLNADTTSELHFRFCILVATCFPATTSPTVPFTITLIYALFLNWKIKATDFFMGFNVTRTKITVPLVTLFVVLYSFGYTFGRDRFFIKLYINKYFLMKLHILKYFHGLVITFLLFLKIYHLLTKGKYHRLTPLEYARICHVALFTFVFWVLTLSSIYSAYQTHLKYPRINVVLVSGFQEACIMQYLFIFSTYLSGIGFLRRFFDRKKVLPMSRQKNELASIT